MPTDTEVKYSSWWLWSHSLIRCSLCSYKRIDEDLSDGHKIMATDRDEIEAECEKVRNPSAAAAMTWPY